jgi:ATP-binding cassette subfamily B protein
MIDSYTGPASKSKPGNVSRILRLFRPYWYRVLVVGLLILITSGLGVVNPLLIKVVFDSALFPSEGGPDLRLLWMIVAVMAVIAVVSGGLGIVQTYITNKVGQSVMRDLRDSVYAHLQGMSLGFFTGTRTGEVQSRISNDVGGVQTVVTSTVSDTIANVVILTSTLIAMLILSWQLTVVAVATAPVFFVLTRWVGARRRRVAAQSQAAMAEVTAVTQETLSVSGIMLAKLFGRQNQEIEHFHQHNQELSDLAVRQQMIGHSFFAVVMTFLSVSPAIIYLLAGYLILGGGSGGISAGVVIAFTTLQTRLYFPIGRLLEVSVELQSSMALFDRIFGYLDLNQEIVDAPDAIALSPSSVSGAIRYDSVRVRYSPTAEERLDDDKPEDNQRWAVDGVDLEVLPGQMAAFVGPSGAGKTTLAYLIPRLYDATEGSVRIDGTDVQRIRLDSLAGLVGFVTQESFLFHSSLRDNLLYAKPDATQREIEEAAKAAYIHDRIMEFPDGYDTVVGERGYRLSGGERQRLAIARVILHQPKILILDEATSALDTASERTVQAALESLMRDRTTVVIAHRLSTILRADVIYAIDRGRVVEHGTHSELLALGGLYSRLYREQFDGGRVECRCEDGIILANGNVVAAEEAVLSGVSDDD